MLSVPWGDPFVSVAAQSLTRDEGFHYHHTQRTRTTRKHVHTNRVNTYAPDLAKPMTMGVSHPYALYEDLDHPFVSAL